MVRPFIRSFPAPRPSRGLAGVAATTVWLGAGVVGLVLAVVFAASVAVLAAISAVLMLLGGALARTRRAERRDDDLIEAHRVGGHSWVAYGFDAPKGMGPDATA